MNRSILRPAFRAALALLLLLALVAAAWLGYAAYLTDREDRACEQTARPIANSNTELQRVLDSYSAANGGVGLQATVIFPDDTVWNGVSGYASREKRCPLTPEHHLYIGSLTKLYVAVLVMDQVEKGTLSLDDPLGRWLDLPYADAVTLRMLLNHTSGIANYTADLRFKVLSRVLPWKQWPADEIVGLIRPKPLCFEPGSRQEYSNSNYVLLVEVLEAATGRPFEVLLRQGLLDELGLQDTYFRTHPPGLPIANGYDQSLLGLGPLSFGIKNVTGFRPSLNEVIMSTSNDVAHFLHALFGDQVVAASTLDGMVTFGQAPVVDMPEQARYGLGIESLVVDGERLLGHEGAVPGYSGIALHNQEKRYTIVILSNLSLIEQTLLLTKVQDIVLQR